MNLVGKILTILILLLSVCFMMIGIIVNASHQNWKELAIANRDKVNDLQRTKSAILSDSTKKNLVIEKEKVARMLRIQQLESQLRLARADLDLATTALAAQTVKAEESFAVVRESENRIAELDTENEKLQSQLRLLTEDVAQQRAKVIDMTGQIFSLNSTKESLTKMRMDLAEMTADQTRVLKKHGLNRFSNTSNIPRELNGVVTFVEDGNIAVNFGEDDGLLKGHRVDIYRDGQYVGTATVFETRSDKSAARIDKALTKIPIQERDNVTTKWVLQDITGR